jgi:hypothetical protein
MPDSAFRPCGDHGFRRSGKGSTGTVSNLSVVFRSWSGNDSGPFSPVRHAAARHRTGLFSGEIGLLPGNVAADRRNFGIAPEKFPKKPNNRQTTPNNPPSDTRPPLKPLAQSTNDQIQRNNFFCPRRDHMIKKTFLLAAGGLLVLGLLFGRNLVPYAGTTISRVQNWAESKVATETKIETARRQLDSVRKSVQPMMYEIARQKVEVGRLAKQIDNQNESLAKAHVHILHLRDHLSSGETAYVSSNGRTYTNDRVREDLGNQFRRYKNGEEQLNTLKATLEMREKGLAAAEKNLEETLARQRTLSVEVDNLEAKMKMLEVRKTADEYARFDDTELSRASQMIDEIRNRLEAESMMLDMAPEAMGDIPMEDVSPASDEDIIHAVDVYFGSVNDDTVVSNQ